MLSPPKQVRYYFYRNSLTKTPCRLANIGGTNRGSSGMRIDRAIGYLSGDLADQPAGGLAGIFFGRVGPLHPSHALLQGFHQVDDLRSL